MMKATLRGAVLLGLLAISVPSFAEVQNVRVGGDITVRAFHRENLDLSDHSFTGTTGGTQSLNNDNFFMTTTGINIGADLTENVSTFVRLTNERDWNVDGGASTENSGDFSVSQSYITLKELFYSPLTLRVGAQPIVWGRGFVLGSSLLPATLARGGDRNGAITANEFTDFTAFDAIRATLDLSNMGGISMPLTADYVYIKLNEGTPGLPDDVNLQGVNFSTKFEQANAELEAYYLNKRDLSETSTATSTDVNHKGSVSTLGIRGSATPVANLSTWGELAYQFGKRAVDSLSPNPATGSGQHGWAVDLGTEYTLADVAMTPKLGAEWIFWSGDNTDGAQAGWDPIARGYFTTALREFQTANGIAGFYPTTVSGVTSAATNQHELGFWTSLKPLEDLSVTPRLSFFWLDKASIQSTGGGNTRRRYAGTEWDTNVVYNYTDDVQLGLLYAIFWPGTVYNHYGTCSTGANCSGDSTAQELVTTVSVKF